MRPLSNHSIRGNYVKCALVPNFLPFVRASFIQLWKGSEELGDLVTTSYYVYYVYINMSHIKRLRRIKGSGVVLSWLLTNMSNCLISLYLVLFNMFNMLDMSIYIWCCFVLTINMSTHRVCGQWLQWFVRLCILRVMSFLPFIALTLAMLINVNNGE